MARMAGAAWLVAAIAVPGCYLVHERESSPDAATPACTVDAVDAAISAVPATPPSADAVAFTIDGQVMFPLDHGPPPPLTLLVRGAHGWGGAGASQFAVLDATGLPVATLTGPSPVEALAFGRDRFALLVSDGDAAFQTQLRWIDEIAVDVASPTPVPGGAQAIDVAWLESRGTFVLARTEPGHADRVDISSIDESGETLESVSVTAASELRGLHVAASARRAFVIADSGTHILQGLLLGGSPLRVLAGPFDLLVNDGHGNAEPRVFAYDQRYFLVTGSDGREVRVSTVDADDCGRTRVQPRVVGPSTSATESFIAAAPEHGFYVVCFSNGATTQVQAIGEDGTPWGRPFDVPSGSPTCGWDGEHVLVVGARGSVLLRPTFL